jgi:hypothetical protein
MTKSDPSQWVAAATNIAVLLGVALLVFELRQNAELSRLEMIQDRIDAFQQAEAGFFDTDLSQVWAKSLTEPESMTLAEIRMMDAYLAIHMAQMMRNHDLENAGLLNEGATARLLEGDAKWLFGSSIGKAWWEHFGQAYPSEFHKLANPIVEAVEADYLINEFSLLQQTIGSD